MPNGAQALLRTLVDAGVTTCFTHPGTSEMHFVAARTAGMSTCSGTANPVRRSRSRRPARGASTVSTSAPNPLATASSTSASVTARSRKQ